MPALMGHAFKSPYNVTPKIAFQYCTSPKTDRPTVDQIAKYQFIIVDEWFCYPDFQNYYGPSNLAHVKRFCQIIEELYEENGKIVCVRTSPNSLQRSNVALLISAYLFFEQKMNLKDIEQTMGPIYKTVIHYRTEGEGVCDHHISIMDCLRGLQMAFNHLPTLEMEAFDVDNLLWMEQPQNGDLNWIVPGRLLALAGPTTQNWPIEKFIEYAQSNSIGCMVRLNRPHYPAAHVIRSGTIEHIEMFMHDGTNPSEQNIRDFIVLVDRMNSQNRGVAVHCRAGLGRTGTMIAAYLLFQYSRDLKRSPEHGNSDCTCLSLTPPEIARAIIGFLRIMRPGSVLSGQPEFLESIAEIVYTAGSENDVNLIAQFSAEESELSVTDSIEEESQIIESISSSASSIEEEEEETLVIRTSKRLKLSTSAASIDKFKQVRHHPISHAGRGHAAEKHSSVQVEKI